MARHNDIGRIGEDLAAKWLQSKQFQIVELNYRRKWGEIDIIASQQRTQAYNMEIVHFVEVKTVSYETKSGLNYAVSQETWRPEENVHKSKIDRLKRAIQTWIAENKYKGDWATDIITVRVVPREKFAQVNFIENVIFD